MISNEGQRRSAVHQRRVLADALDELVAQNSATRALRGTGDDSDLSVLRFRIEQAALSGQISDLDMQIQDYETRQA
jgi:hypothetical protein